MSKYDDLEYPVFSNVPHRKSNDDDVNRARRRGHADCAQWMNSSNAKITGVSAEKPKNPYIEPLNGTLADAYEEGFSAALESVRGRGF